MRSKIDPETFGKICAFVATELIADGEVSMDTLLSFAVAQFPNVDAIDLQDVLEGAREQWFRLQIDVPE